MARQRAIQLAKRFNCYTPNDFSKAIDCLRMIPAKNMSAVVDEFYVNIINDYLHIDIILKILLF